MSLTPDPIVQDPSEVQAKHIDDAITSGQFGENARSFLESLPLETLLQITTLRSEKPKKDDIDLMIETLSETEHTLDLEEHKFPVKDKTGKLTIYTIRELGQYDRNEYMDFQMKKGKFSNEGKFAGMKDIKGLEVKLLLLSVFDESGKGLTEPILQSWPGRLIKKIAAISARISGLDEKAEQRAKNS